MKASELRAKDAAALEKEVGDLLKAHFNLRMQKATQQLTDHSRWGRRGETSHARRRSSVAAPREEEQERRNDRRREHRKKRRQPPAATALQKRAPWSAASSATSAPRPSPS